MEMSRLNRTTPLKCVVYRAMTISILHLWLYLISITSLEAISIGGNNSLSVMHVA